MASGNKFTHIDKTWQPIDLDPVCRNWIARKDGGGFVRMTNAAAALQQNARGLNHQLGLAPRIIFCKAETIVSRSTTSSEPSQGTDNQPAYMWFLNDVVVNGTARMFRSISLPRESGSSNAFYQRTGGEPGDPPAVDANTIGPLHVGTKGSASVFSDRWHDEVLFTRPAANRAPTGSRESEGVATFNSAQILAFLVQDEEIYALDTTEHDYIPAMPAPGNPILGGQALERIRAKLHDVRTKNLPIVVNWSAYAQAGDMVTSMTANTGGSTGIRITDSTNFRNLLIASTSDVNPSFSQTLQGFPAHVQHCGYGSAIAAVDATNQLDVGFHILAEATTADATIRVIGPSGFSSNLVNITIPVASGLAWHGNSGGTDSVKLDTSVANNDTSTGRPKIDIWGKAGASGGLFIYGIRGLGQI